MGMPAMPGSALVVIEPKPRFWQFQKLSSIASDGLRPDSVSMDVPAEAPGG